MFNWKSWEGRELKKICEYYIFNKLCEIKDNEILQYQELLNKVEELDTKRETFLEQAIMNNPDVRRFLQIYSQFCYDVELRNILLNSGDWFMKIIVKTLTVTPDDLKEIRNDAFVPSELMEKFKIFDPGIYIESGQYRIEYDFNKINIIDIAWDDIGKNRIDPEVFISHFSPIHTTKANQFDDDLPF